MSGARLFASLAGLLALAAAPAPAQEGAAEAAQAPARAAEDDAGDRPAASRLRPAPMTADAARTEHGRTLRWLVETQNEDGSWASPVNEHLSEIGFAWPTYHAWQYAACALACLALLEAPETPERREALERGLDWLATSRRPVRGDDWDVDSTWGSLYGFVACARAAVDERFQEGPLAQRVAERGKELLADLLHRQTPDGGWAYYDNPPYTAKPTWATSFCTALVLPWLERARTELGWEVPEVAIERARRLVRRCSLPNGAYSYDYRPIQRGFTGESINDVKGSLGRIQVCNWALARTGAEWITPERVREGLEAFFEHHNFLDLARMRPIPHEGYYANAGYFYFFAHYYAALAIELLPDPEERAAWHARLRPHLAKALTEAGATSDFLTSGYMVVASTALASLSLGVGLE